ncbi:hypothetical protein AX17_000288 [Amanita inopinata Kibby_2008]|nr:hypothetical protein AX17_000288 [Amanita inopinata Kibby_2008]
MAELPATQQIQNLPPIFRQVDGSSLHVFVEACGIVNRPKVVRTLKKAGAIICNDPKHAQIILVDPRSTEGRRFVHDWGSDIDKVVLDYAWVSKCLAAGKALKEEDQWGNCLTQDEGLSTESEPGFEDDAVIASNPLPTPRITPVHSSAPPVRKLQFVADKPVDLPIAPANVPAVETHDSTAAPASSVPDQNSILLSTAGAGMSSIHIQQYAPGVAGPTHPGQTSTLEPQGMLEQANQAGAMTSNNFSQLQIQTQQLWAQMSSAFSQNSAQYNTDPLVMSLMDAIRTHGIIPSSMPQLKAVPISNVQVPNTQEPGLNYVVPPPMTQPPSDMSKNRAAAFSQPLSPPPSLSQTKKQRQVSVNKPPQSSRRKSSANIRRSTSPLPPVPSSSSVTRAKKTKRRETSPQNRRNTIAYTGPSRPLHATDSPVRSPQAHPSQKIFKSGNGEELAFFVQIDQPNRLNIVTAIKKNGGRITNTQLAAEFAVLYSHSNTFLDLLKSTIEAGKTAVSASFINDCIKGGTLLDPTEYKFKLPEKSSRKRPIAPCSSSDVEEITAAEVAAAAKAETQRLARNQKQQERRKRARRERQLEQNQSVVKQEPQEAEGLRMTSPTPPPAHTRLFTSKGYPRYSEAERAYLLRHAKVLLERDHRMSAQAMAECLFKKIPHHSVHSWRSYISCGIVKSEIEQMRKRAATDQKKSLNAKQTHYVKEEPQDTVMFDEPHGTLTAENLEETRGREEEDLTVICDFFAYGGGDEQDDVNDTEALWNRLSNKVTCKTASSWEEFYNQHYNTIQERYTILTQGLQT